MHFTIKKFWVFSCYKKCYNELYPLLYNPINTILRILGYRRWAIVGITLFSISPGSPEQEIHHDASEETKRIFITIPLHKTTIDMGPTVFYDDNKLKGTAFGEKYNYTAVPNRSKFL